MLEDNEVGQLTLDEILADTGFQEYAKHSRSRKFVEDSVTEFVGLDRKLTLVDLDEILSRLGHFRSRLLSGEEMCLYGETSGDYGTIERLRFSSWREETGVEFEARMRLSYKNYLPVKKREDARRKSELEALQVQAYKLGFTLTPKK